MACEGEGIREMMTERGVSLKKTHANLSIEYLDFSEFIKSSINVTINATGHTCSCISILTML